MSREVSSHLQELQFIFALDAAAINQLALSCTDLGSGYGMSAIDPDCGVNAIVNYTLPEQTVAARSQFSIKPDTGELCVAASLDHELNSDFEFPVVATDRGGLSTTAMVKIQLLDINDNVPAFTVKDYNVSLKEGRVSSSEPIVAVTATDADSGRFGTVTYRIINGNDNDVFRIDRSTGEMFVTKPALIQANGKFDLEISATDGGGLTAPQGAVVHVNVMPTGVGSALFDKPRYNFRIREDVRSGTIVGNLKATAGGDLYKSLIEGGRWGVRQIIGGGINDFNLEGSVRINFRNDAARAGPVKSPKTRRNRVTGCIKRRDKGTSGRRDGAGEGRLLGTCYRDKDCRERKQLVRYSIVSGDPDHHFSIEPHTGAIRTSTQLDREVTSSYLLNVRAANSNPASYDQTQVQITLEDVNDNAPEFGTSSVKVSVAESASIGSVVYAARATDEDNGKNGEITYTLLSATGPSNTFAVNSQHGLVTLLRPLDYENLVKHTLIIAARDGGTPPLSANLTLVVDVQDVNDNAPVFEHDSYSANVLESEVVKAKILEIQAIDKDTGNNARVTYKILSENNTNEEHFNVQPATGWVYLTKPLDRETMAKHKMSIIATDNGIPPLSASASLVVNVVDANDNDPAFMQTAYEFQVEENHKAGAYVGKISATDADLGENAAVRYSLFPSNTSFVVNPISEAKDQGNLPRSSRVPIAIKITDVNDNSPEIIDPREDVVSVREEQQPGAEVARVKAIDKDNGVLTATQSLASENGKFIHLRVMAKDKGNPPQSSVGLIEIRVGDFSDQSPTLSFQNATYNVTIDENLSYGKEVLQVTALRSDGRRQRIIYEFGNGNDQYAFEIDSNTGVIRVNNSENLDYESHQGPSRQLVVVARTEGSPNMYAYCDVTVNLLDQNDHAPKFTQQQYIANVLEGNTKGEFVVQLAAKDDDRGANARILYHIVDGNHDNAFIIEPAFSGSVKTNIVLDREIREMYKLTVIATDEGDPQMTGTATLRINVVDVNDNQPTFPPPNVISISEGAEVGSILTSVTANDVDTYPALKYAIVQGDNTFSIDRYSGKIVLNKPLDYEMRQEYEVNITASDTEHVARTTLTIKVTDVNDNSPVFDEISYNRVLPEGSGSLEIAKVSARDRDIGDNGRLSYSLLRPSDGYYIDAITGAMFVNYSALPANQRDTQLAVLATDHGKPNRSAVASVRISTGASSEIKPFIGQDTYRITVNEDTEKGSSLLQIGGINDVLKKYNLDFHIISGNEGDTFDVTMEGALILVNSLDREVQDSYVLGLAAVEQGKVLSYNQNKTSITIFVTVADANDNAPVFSLSDFDISVSESVKIGHTLTQVSATDADLFNTPNAAILYNITSGDDEKLFYIHPTTGILTVNKTLDYDIGNPKFKLVIVACDQGSPCLCNTAYIEVDVLDENDNAPTFPVSEYFETIGENERVGTSIFIARATDLDKGKYGKLNYSIIPNYNRNDDSWKMFQIDAFSGLVNSNAVFDYEQKYKYEFSIKASDLGGKSSTVKVRIDVESRDEFYPQFTQKTYNFGVPKSGSLPMGYMIGQVTATDRDKGIDGRIVYQLSTSHSYFKINRTTGIIILKKKVDSVQSVFGGDKSISLVVTASSGRQGSLTNKTAVEMLLDPLAVVSDNTNLINDTSVAQSSGLSDWALGLLIAFIFIIIIFAAAFLFLHMKNKRHKKVNKPDLSSDGVGATNSYVDPSGFDTIQIRNTGPVNAANQFAPPKYDEIPPYGPHTASSNSGAATTSELSGSDQSGSSGRGSAEDGEDGEDEEIRMINEGPLQRESGLHRQSNGVDDDNLSDVSVHNTQEYLARLGIVDTGTGGGASTSSRRCSENVGNKDTMLHHGPIDSMHIFDEDGAHENDITNLIYAKLNEVTGSERASSADEASAAVDRAMALGAFPSAPGENTAVPTAGPSMTGSLSSIVHSEEELTGSYNWDYLLDWGPRYQPLAHVFSEIAHLKDDAVSLQSGNSGASSAKSKGTSITGGKSVPPPLLTTVAPRSCPAPSLSCRQPQHLLPRSPISHDVPGGFSAAAAMSPSFSPSLSPLATRSPSMSPLVGPGLPPAPANRKPPHSTMRI
ncbi:unnamed protein product, partial [Iphiclides podalirius]